MYEIWFNKGDAAVNVNVQASIFAPPLHLSVGVGNKAIPYKKYLISTMEGEQNTALIMSAINRNARTHGHINLLFNPKYAYIGSTLKEFLEEYQGVLIQLESYLPDDGMQFKSSMKKPEQSGIDPNILKKMEEQLNSPDFKLSD